MAKRKRKTKTDWRVQLKFEIIGLVLLVLSIVTFAKLGSVGEVFVLFFRFFLGEWYVAMTIGVFVTALYTMIKRKLPSFVSRRLVGLYLFIFSFLLLSHLRLFENLAGQEGFQDRSVLRNTWNLYWLQLHNEAPIDDFGGGMIGALGFALSHFLFDSIGTFLISFFCMVVAFLLITGKSLSEVLAQSFSKTYAFFHKMITGIRDDITDWSTKIKERLQEQKEQRKKEKEQLKQQRQQQAELKQQQAPAGKHDTEIPEVEIRDFTASQVYKEQKQEQLTLPLQDEQEQKKETAQQEGDTEVLPVGQPLVQNEIENKDYTLPPLDLLKRPSQSQSNGGQHILARENAKKLKQTLDSFGVKAEVTKVHIGPAVTKYEVHPNVGVKVSKIVNLTDDLALALAAKDIRIEAPIPGKSAIGIEVPNQEVAIVTLREVLDSPESHSESNVLSVALGRDISGEPVLASLNKMPHLLVAGATGSGKSVCINGIITSILLKAKPHEVKLIMIDPKMVELNMYNGIPHLLTPVVTEPKKASQALKKVVSEMERRYELFSHSGTRNIEGYNEQIVKQNEKGEAKQPTLPFIVVIVDELADLMMVASGDVEDSITRLAQMARAAGIHMIIATQRPSVDVITGVIKANIPSRIAFGVSSQTDSRTILDGGGAEKLLGRGDMLYLPVGASKPTRVQGAFLSDDEVEEIVDYVISQQKAQYQEDMTPTEEEIHVPSESTDELYDDAVELVMNMNTASVSMLQRRFRIGYTRAARLIDEMEARGIVGPYEGSKPREVLVAKQEEEASSQ
ncbi:DNA translocase FtsK [Alkalihalobacillus sp. LMS39]|uniref:DNA translocase FtsK n=1 Tax=Alkalihalobacillus sp. LMS39 TaxID=2924032 RepID=UPI001FB2318F|nr:DNA translocase FtsK [Alkalihalobacillus sp. LMS39]UOE92786.1 DNA translocase FtsK [Alkalihalobacillus sp. LMS39]